MACHVEVSLKLKIGKGQFIDLEKLLPRAKLKRVEKEDQPLQLTSKNGFTYLQPAIDRENRITNVNRWDQAFRVYLTVYCSYNPSRFTEIMQYVTVIHRAASTYHWDNVAYYDNLFRQLMAEQPLRSWGRIYQERMEHGNG